MTSTPAPSAPAAAHAPPDAVDWSQIWMPGPRRRFSAEEMARAGSDRPSRTLLTAVPFNAALVGLMVLQWAPAELTAVLTGLLVLLVVLGLAGARHLWRVPHRRPLALWTGVATSTLVALTIVVVEAQGLPRGSAARSAVLGMCLGGALLLSVLWWFVVVWRAQQISTRLREQAEQQRALALARQLATAQIRPHFLFNSLASLQHWVQAKDDRAAPLLQALSGFLRASLPLFDRDRLPLADEAAVVREYLAVMQLRLGTRLRWSLHIDDTVAQARLPPGLLLTLVENAVEHGAMAALAGAEIEVRAAAEANTLVLTVRDTGPGTAPGWTEGLGLANSRERLAQAFGSAATLTLADAPGGGCIATVRAPMAALAAAATAPAALPINPSKPQARIA
jgi:hypothetical protein